VRFFTTTVLISGEGDLLRLGGGDLDLDLELLRSEGFASLLLGLRLERFFGGDLDFDLDLEDECLDRLRDRGMAAVEILKTTEM